MTEILDLSKAAEPRPTVRLPQKGNPDGKAYPLAAPSDFGVRDLQRLLGLKDEADRLEAIEKRTPAQERELTRRYGEAVKVLVPSIEPATLKALPRAAREQVLVGWIGHHLARPDKPGQDERGNGG